VTQNALARRVGLARALSKLGFCSRSQAFDLIRAGRVRVNRLLQLDPERPINLEADRIEVDGESVASARKVYLVLNKPRGVVTTAADEKGRNTVYDLLDKDLPWVAPVGRLDKASEGLLVLTNDSEWSARVLAPQTHLDKTYHVHVACVANEKLVATLSRGVRTKDGDSLHARSVRILRGGAKNTWLEIVLDEGRNRHIRRMLEALDIGVLRLVRVAIGPIVLGTLTKGTARPLTSEEKRALDETMKPKAVRTRKGSDEKCK
jgi:23S rRNA pseudouridine2605 synthase